MRSIKVESAAETMSGAPIVNPAALTSAIQTLLTAIETLPSKQGSGPPEGPKRNVNITQWLGWILSVVIGGASVAYSIDGNEPSQSTPAPLVTTDLSGIEQRLDSIESDLREGQSESTYMDTLLADAILSLAAGPGEIPDSVNRLRYEMERRKANK